jgi:hypothetical protein
VIAVGESDKFALFRAGQISKILDGEFERDFDGGGTIIGKKHVGELRVNHAKPVASSLGGFVSEAGE